MRLALFLIGLAVVVFVSAEVYESVDAEGNATYSDEPSPGATQIDVPDVQTVAPDAPAPPPPTIKPLSPAETKAFAGYREVSLVIASGEDPTSVWLETGGLPVSVALVPKLQAQLGHTLELLVNGRAVSPPGTATTFKVTDLDPGAYSLQAVVLNSHGNEIARSATDTVYVHHHRRHHR
ncbi:MAG: DUF4124 domain-containing protein [Gammaproteobacteria bacterium]